MKSGLVFLSIICAVTAQWTGTVCTGTNSFSGANIQSGLAVSLGVAASQVSLGSMSGNCASFSVSGTVSTAAWSALCWSALQQAQVQSGVVSISGCSGTPQYSGNQMSTMMPYGMMPSGYGQTSGSCGCGCGSSSNNWLPMMMMMMMGGMGGMGSGMSSPMTATVCMGSNTFNAGNLQAAIANYFGVAASSVTIGTATSTGVTTCVPVSFPSTWYPDTTKWSAYCSTIVPSMLSSAGITSISCPSNTMNSMNWNSMNWNSMNWNSNMMNSMNWNSMMSMPSSGCGCGTQMNQYPWMAQYPWMSAPSQYSGAVSTAATVCTSANNFNSGNIQAAIANFFGISSSSVTISGATTTGTQTCASVTYPSTWAPDQTRWAAYCSSSVASTLSLVGITSVTCQGATTWTGGSSSVCAPTQSFSLTNIQAAVASYFGISSTQVTVSAGAATATGVTCTTVSFPSGWVADQTKWNLYCSSTVQTVLANIGVTSVTCAQSSYSSGMTGWNSWNSNSMMQMFMQMCPMHYMMWQMMGTGTGMSGQGSWTGMNGQNTMWSGSQQICTAVNNFNAANVQAAIASLFGIGTSQVSIGSVSVTGTMACAPVSFPSSWIPDTTKWSIFCSSSVTSSLANVGVTQVGCSNTNWNSGSLWSTVCTPQNSFSTANIQTTIANFFGVSTSSVSVGAVSNVNALSCAQVSFPTTWTPDTTKWSWFCANNAQTGLPGVGVTSVTCNANSNYNNGQNMMGMHSGSMYQMMMMMMMMQPSSSCGCSSCSSGSNNNMCNMWMMQMMMGK